MQNDFFVHKNSLYFYCKNLSTNNNFIYNNNFNNKQIDKIIFLLLFQFFINTELNVFH